MIAHTGGMLTSGVDVIIVLGSIDLGDDENDLLPLNLDIQVTADVGPIGVAKPKGGQSSGHMKLSRGLLPTRPRP